MLDEIAAENGLGTGGLPRTNRLSWTMRGCGPGIGERERKASVDVKAAAAPGRHRRLASAAARGHHRHHPRPSRRLAVVLEPARDDDDPRPLVMTENRWAGRISSADFPAAAGPDRIDEPAEAGGAPASPGNVGTGVGAVVGGRGLRFLGRAKSVAPDDEPDVDPEPTGDARSTPPSGAPDGRIARPPCASPSDLRVVERDNAQIRARSTPRPTRWRGPSTGSSAC